MIIVLIFQRVVEYRYRDIINRLLNMYRSQRKKVKLTDLKIYLIALLRLRQGTAHPFLLEPAMKKTLRPGDLEEIVSKLAQVGGRTPVIEQIRSWRATKMEGLGNVPDPPASMDQNDFGSSKFGNEINMENHIGMALAWQNDSVCNECHQETTNPQVTGVSIAQPFISIQLLLTMKL
jgi:hypothetical protein